MSYTALYRKYRPGSFGGVVGQDHIVRTLANQINSGRISHAYLFCGTRGTGKTSVAKIFAKAVNCENMIDGEPCGICDFCKIPGSQASMIIYEIDAASNNGVDNIRDIIETVKYPPAMGRYKVYIIDEVHMLSTGAFNALLKTLEEPPEHVVFILATTEPHKIPPTIHSRCQRFDFRRISAKDMSAKLHEYMEEENVQADGDALAYISRVSDGAMRDALSILDQCLSFYYGEQITLPKVLAVLGAVSNDVLFKITDALYSRDSVLCMRVIDETVAAGKDVSHFVEELIEHIRNLLVAAAVDINSPSLDFSIENAREVCEQSGRISKAVLLNYINVFSDLQGKLKYASNERVLFEVTCLKLCNSEVSQVPDDMGARMAKLENELSNIAKAHKTVAREAVTRVGIVKRTVQKEIAAVAPKLEKAIPSEIKKVIETWGDFLASLRSSESSLCGFLEQTAPCYLDNSILTIACSDAFAVDYLKKSSDKIRTLLAKKYSRQFELRITNKNEHDKQHKQLYGVKDDVFESFSNKLNW